MVSGGPPLAIYWLGWVQSPYWYTAGFQEGLTGALGPILALHDQQSLIIPPTGPFSLSTSPCPQCPHPSSKSTSFPITSQCGRQWPCPLPLRVSCQFSPQGQCFPSGSSNHRTRYFPKVWLPCLTSGLPVIYNLQEDLKTGRPCSFLKGHRQGHSCFFLTYGILLP